MKGSKKPEPSLYGLKNSNRRGRKHFTKNNFNSSFPAALLCYMGEKRKDAPPMYFHLAVEEKALVPRLTDLPVFKGEGQTKALFPVESCSDLYFAFEAEPPRFRSLLLENEECPRSDLVVVEVGETKILLPNDSENRFSRPFEVKLTVVPDQSTCERPEGEWSAEVVVRPVASKTALLSLLLSLGGRPDKVVEARESFRNQMSEFFRELDKRGEDHARLLRDLGEERVTSWAEGLLHFLVSNELQSPVLLQPTWWTEGKSPFLREKAFDYIVWSDAALFYTAVRQVKKERGREKVRPLRATYRFLATFFQALKASEAEKKETLNKISLKVYSELTLGKQTDKEFSLHGAVTREYLGQAMSNGPRISKEEVLEHVFINVDLKELLGPERRLDASLLIEALLREKG